jgi:hypothetical protein
LEEERTRLAEELTDMKEQMEQQVQQAKELIRQKETETETKVTQVTLLAWTCTWHESMEGYLTHVTLKFVILEECIIYIRTF